MKCNKCGNDLIIDYNEQIEDTFVICKSCNAVIDKSTINPLDILDIVRQGHYSKKAEKIAIENANNYILQLIKRHSIYNIFNKN
jgi:DNA-directed RNA polymerase subunit M/transcription elongation factor TFIIS